MLQNTTIVCLVIILLAGCSKKSSENSPPPEAETICVIQSETLNDKTYRTYEYTEDQKLYRIVQYETLAPGRPQKRYTFEYDEDEKVSVFRETGLLAPLLNYQYSLHYNEKGLIDTISKARVTNTGLLPAEIYRLDYDADKRLTRYSWKNSYWRYEYDEGSNVKKWFAKIEGQHTEEVLLAEYSNYDDQKKIYDGAASAELINLIEGGGTSVHNPGSFKFYQASTEPSQTGITTYFYNEAGFPTEASISLFSTGGAASTQVYKFTYECL